MSDITVTFFDDDEIAPSLYSAALKKLDAEIDRLGETNNELIRERSKHNGAAYLATDRAVRAENAAKALHALLAKALPELRDHAHNISHTAHSDYVLWLTDKVKEAVLTDPLKAV